jgi:hypothetical protein
LIIQVEDARINIGGARSRKELVRFARVFDEALRDAPYFVTPRASVVHRVLRGEALFSLANGGPVRPDYDDLSPTYLTDALKLVRMGYTR